MNDDILERFHEGIRKFNNGSFYECHDILEDVWFDIRGQSRKFYQGLIHLAVGFYHILERNNPKGAISQLTKGTEKLSDYKPSYQGVELENLLAKVHKCIQSIKDIQPGTTNDFDPGLIPQISFDRQKFSIV